jgi:hypothetical protein
MLWLNSKGWFNPPNPFMPIVQRQFFERHEYWKEMKDRPTDRTTLTDILLLIKQDHPEATDYQPLMQSLGVIGAAVESM